LPRFRPGAAFRLQVAEAAVENGTKGAKGSVVPAAKVGRRTSTAQVAEAAPARPPAAQTRVAKAPVQAVKTASIPVSELIDPMPAEAGAAKRAVKKVAKDKPAKDTKEAKDTKKGLDKKRDKK
jgi:hypothetical protein